MMNLTEELIKKGLITREQLSDARAKQVGAKRPVLTCPLNLYHFF